MQCRSRWNFSRWNPARNGRKFVPRRHRRKYRHLKSQERANVSLKLAVYFQPVRMFVINNSNISIHQRANLSLCDGAVHEISRQTHWHIGHASDVTYASFAWSLFNSGWEDSLSEMQSGEFVNKWKVTRVWATPTVAWLFEWNFRRRNFKISTDQLLRAWFLRELWKTAMYRNPNWRKEREIERKRSVFRFHVSDKRWNASIAGLA